MRRAKSTVVGVETTCGELLWPFSVMELMVTSNPTTEGKGASSLVTNTWPDCCDCPGGVEFEELDPQPTSMKVASRAAAVNAKNLFMPSSG
jgi:hypothetical protein